MENPSKLRRTFGMVLLIYGGILLFGEIIFLLFPSVLSDAGVERPWYRHLSSLFLSIGSVGFGLYLRGKKLGENFVSWVIIFSLMVSPLPMLEGALKINNAPLQPVLRFGTTWILITGVGIALACVPYIFKMRILKWLSEKPTRSKIAPIRTLHIIGLALAIAPANAGFYLSVLGAPKTDMYYFVFLSYLCAGAWWALWHFRYSKEDKKSNNV
jgi:hypothetical protein